MKTKLLYGIAVGAAMSVAGLATAQNNTFPANGNVGIGTLNPNAELDINGNVLVGGLGQQGFGANDYFEVVVDGNGLLHAGPPTDLIPGEFNPGNPGNPGDDNGGGIIINPGGGGDPLAKPCGYNVTAWDDRGPNPNAIFLSCGFDRLGIGADDPLSAFHVKGTDGRITIEENPGDIWEIHGTSNAFAVKDADDGTYRMWIKNSNGYMGLGTNAPAERLHVEGNVRIRTNSFTQNGRLFTQGPSTSLNQWTRGVVSNNLKWNESTNMWDVNTSNFSDFSAMRFENGGVIGFYTRLSTGSPYSISNNNLTQYRIMTLRQDNVTIGTDRIVGGAHTDYRLSVDGKVVAQEIVVTLDNWADYVFADDYQLQPLTEVAAFIEANNHLPAIPSEAEVAENGVEMGEMFKLQMQKIEELTLYIIEQNKAIEQIKAENEAIKAMLNQQK